MILLADYCLLFENASGESVPYTADTICVEVYGEAAGFFDPEFVKHAAAAVFHYYRDVLGRKTVTVAEFTLSLEKLLRGFKLTRPEPAAEASAGRVIQFDLRLLAPQGDAGCELLFFPRLREELHTLLGQEPQMLCLRGLRQCVKQLSGAQRWTRGCQDLHDRIVEYLRCCMSQENHGINCALVVK